MYTCTYNYRLCEHRILHQEDIQAKTAQVKQYKKQTDQFRDQVEAGKDQAEILKAQVSQCVVQLVL